MEDQVLSISQMQKLQELAVDISKASMCWIIEENGNRNLTFNRPIGDKPLLPTFTLHDIINILPQYIEEKEIGRFDYELRVKKDEVTYESYDAFDKEGEPYILNFYTIDYDECNTILDCAFNMLKWCIEEDFLDKDKYVKNV